MTDENSHHAMSGEEFETALTAATPGEEIVYIAGAALSGLRGPTGAWSLVWVDNAARQRPRVAYCAGLGTLFQRRREDGALDYVFQVSN